MLSMALVIVALMGPAVFLVRFRAADMFLKSAQARGASIARSIGAVATPALLSYNYVGLEEAASMAAREDDIVYIVIHDKEGLVAGDSRTAGLEAPVHGRRGERALQAKDVLVQRRASAGRRPVRRAHRRGRAGLPARIAGKMGHVRVGISLEPIMQGVARITRSLITISLLGAALCLWGARWASRRITRPLHTLRDGTMALAHGDLAHRIHINTRDEIEDLAGRFNEMADEIEARQAEAREARGALETLNASLEEEVKERTAAHLRSERRYRTLVEWSPMGIGLVQQGRLVYSNAACRDLVGDPGPGPLTDTIHEEDRGAFLIQLHAWDRQAPFGPVEARFGPPEGSLRYVEMRWMPLDVDGEAADPCS
jgi:two-component system sensor histidine kinase AtoS